MENDFEYTLISLNCLTGWIHRQMGLGEYTNPFVWTMFETKSFIYLVQNFHNINFEKIVFVDNKEDLKKYIVENRLYDLMGSRYNELIHDAENSSSSEIYYAIVDNCIMFSHIHMKYEKMKTYEYNKNCQNGIECLYNIYYSRIKRMVNFKPLFIYNIQNNNIKIDSIHDVIYLTTNESVKNKNTILFYYDKEEYDWSEFTQKVLVKDIARYITKFYCKNVSLENKYTIFSTSCLDGWVSRELNIPNNCFTWYGITMNSFSRLIKEYNTINFENFVLFNNKDKFLEYCLSLNDEFIITEAKKVYNINKNFYGVLDNRIIFSSFNYSFEYLKRLSDFDENTDSELYMRNVFLRRLKYMKNRKPLFLFPASNDKAIKYYTSQIIYPIIFIRKESERSEEVFNNVFYYNDQEISDFVHNKNVHKQLSVFISEYINNIEEYEEVKPIVKKVEEYEEVKPINKQVIIRKRNNKMYRPKR